MNCRSSLSVKDFSIFVHLGWPSAERQTPQKILVSFVIGFPKIPEACKTDDLKDTICYNEICSALKTLATSQEFRTIEFLGHSLFKKAREFIPDTCQLKFTLQKVKPPVDDLKGGASFILEGE